MRSRRIFSARFFVSAAVKQRPMTNSNEPIPYAKAESQRGWLSRHKTDAATRMVAFAFLAIAGLGWRYLTTAVNGNSDLPDGGRYLLIGSCICFAFEYVVSLIG